MIRVSTAITAFVFAVSTSALAGESIQYKRSNLTDGAYVESVYDDIYHAAKRTCGYTYNGRPMSDFAKRSCIKSSIEAAVSKIDHPSLTAYSTKAVKEIMLAAK